MLHNVAKSGEARLSFFWGQKLKWPKNGIKRREIIDRHTPKIKIFGLLARRAKPPGQKAKNFHLRRRRGFGASLREAQDGLFTVKTGSNYGLDRSSTDMNRRS